MGAPAETPSDDQWHVRVGSEEKVLTLDQLDDLFRLEIIDGETKVWQPGMPEWLPLSVVAGMDEPAAAAAAPPPPPPALASSEATFAPSPSGAASGPSSPNSTRSPASARSPAPARSTASFAPNSTRSQAPANWGLVRAELHALARGCLVQ